MRKFLNNRGVAGTLRLSIAGVAIALLGPLGGADAVHAQFGPPMSVFGSISDSAGAIDDGVTVEGYVGNTLCGKGRTQFTGDGEGRVTVYFVNVVSREQTSNCGTAGADVRIKIGERFAPGSVKWDAGPQRFDVTFGTATPAPIPTFTPTPPRTTPGASGTGPAGTPTPVGTPAGPATPGAGGSATASGTATRAATGTASATPTLRGGVTSTGGGSGSGGGGDDGFPVWAAVVSVLGGVALVGGGVGFMMARNRGGEDDPESPVSPA